MRFLFVVVLILAGTEPARGQKAFVVLSVATIGTAIYDMETTVAALDRCAGCREGNPLIRNFVQDRRLAFTIVTGTAATSVYLSHRLRTQGRKYWWLPLVTSIGLHITAGVYNQQK